MASNVRHGRVWSFDTLLTDRDLRHNQRSCQLCRLFGGGGILKKLATPISAVLFPTSLLKTYLFLGAGFSKSFSTTPCNILKSQHLIIYLYSFCRRIPTPSSTPSLTPVDTKPSQYLLQVMIQMPGGEMVPVHIPAAVTNQAGSPQQPAAAPVALTTSVMTAGAMVTTNATSASMSTQSSSGMGGLASSLTKQVGIVKHSCIDYQES